MTPRSLTLPLAVLGIAAVVAGCGSGGSSSADGGSRLTVVATTTQLGDFVREVGGDDVSVHQILRPNTDPHDYEPRPADVASTASAQVVFESGDNLDHWMADILEQASDAPATTDLSGTNVARLPGETEGEEASKYDPHWWHDPRNAEAAVAAIATDLGKADPDHAAAYERRADAYVAKLRQLDAGIRSCIAEVPAAQRKLVTDHDAFNYFASRYGIEVIGAVIPSQSTQAQTSAKDVAALTAVIRREGVEAVFPESSVNPKLATAIARQTGASSDYTLYGDTLGPQGSDGSTYLAMEAHNADAMVRGFSGGTKRCTGLPTT